MCYFCLSLIYRRLNFLQKSESGEDEGRRKGSNWTAKEKEKGEHYKPVPFLKKCPADKERGRLVFLTIYGAVIQLVYCIV